MRRSPRLSLVFGRGIFLFGLGALIRIVPFLVAVVAGDLGMALATRTSPTSRVGRVDTGCWGGLPSSLLSVSTTLLLLLLLPSLLVGSLAVFGTRGVWAL